MKITEKEFDEISRALDAAFSEGMMDENVGFPAFDKVREVYRRYRWFMDSLNQFDPSELCREFTEEFGEGSWDNV